MVKNIKNKYEEKAQGEVASVERERKLKKRAEALGIPWPQIGEIEIFHTLANAN